MVGIDFPEPTPDGDQLAADRPFRPGVNFRNGKLYVFGREGVTVIRPWPRPRAWRKTRTRPWRAVRPRIDVRELPDYLEEARWENYLGCAMNHVGGWFGTLHCNRSSRVLGFDVDVEYDTNGLPDGAPKNWSEAAEKACSSIVGWRNHHHAWAKFYSEIPDTVRLPLATYAKRQWHVLNLIARCPGADELVRSAPALAFCLASSWVFHRPPVKRPLRSTRWLVREPRRRIAAWLGFPGTQATVNILGKLTEDAIDIPRLLYLRAGLFDDGRRRALGHLPAINSGVVRIVTDPSLNVLVTPSFLRQIARGEAGETGLDAAYMLKDTLRMLDQLGRRRLPRLRSLDALRQFHDDAVREINRLLPNEDEATGVPPGPLQELWPRAFPEPPIPGSTSVLPLSSPAMLLEEGRTMRHCVAAYAPDVAEDVLYFYRVEGAERATLMLRRTTSGWRIGEVSGPNNRTVTCETLEEISRWLQARGRQTEMPFRRSAP
jgi:PcfJ-like protein